jgi:hypothetical protein
LRLAVLEDLEVVLSESANKMARRVVDDDVNVNHACGDAYGVFGRRRLSLSKSE